MEIFKIKASEYFEYYYNFLERRDCRSVNELLGAAFRVNELLKKEVNGKSRSNLLESPDFLLIKMLRNLNEHSGHLTIDFMTIDDFCRNELSQELQLNCLIPQEVYRQATHGKEVRFEDMDKIHSAAGFLGSYVDIHPAIFNLSVRIYELLVELGIELETKEFREIKDSYEKEKIHNHRHYVKPLRCEVKLLSDGSAIDGHIIPLGDNAQPVEGLPDYNLLVGLDNPLEMGSIDFDDLAKNFKGYVKSIDGRAQDSYQAEFASFEFLYKNNTLSPLRHLLAYKPKDLFDVVFDIGSHLERYEKEEAIRLRLLNYNLPAIIEFINKGYVDRYVYTQDLMLFLSMVVNIRLHGLELKETRVMKRIVNATSFVQASKALRFYQRDKGSSQKFSHMIYTQIVMLMIEFPFKDHQHRMSSTSSL